MYLSRKHKIIIVWNLGTGGVSLHRYLRLNVPDSNFGPDHPKYGPKKGHWHTRICQIVNYFGIPPEELPQYRIASFYRDPIERLLVTIPYQLKHFPGRFPEDITFDEYFEAHGQYIQPQWLYLTDRDFMGIRCFDGIDLNWQWFNYHDYENEFRRLAGWFGLTPGEPAPMEFATTGNEIPHLNSNPHLEIEDLTKEQIARCKEKYWEDYELFEQNGIFVPSRDL